MVDAISSVLGQPIKPIKKDNAINWKQCTSEEIIEHEKEGQEVPEYILQWAKEFSKLENAPDDITYEMAMGASTMAGVNANTDGQNDSGDDNENKPNTAEAIRQQFSLDGVSVYKQAKSFKTYSDQYTGEIQGLMDSMEEYITQSSEAADAANETKDDVMSRIQSLLASKKQNKKGDMSSAVEAARIDNEIKALGQAGLNTIQAVSAPVDNTENSINDAEFTSITGRQFGDISVTLGNELIEKGFNPFNMGPYILGRETKKSGEGTITKSNEGDLQFSDNHVENIGYVKSINSNIDEIRKASGASINTSDEDGDGENEDETKVDNTNNKSDTNEDNVQEKPDKVDDKVLTDPNEILKLKQKRGLA